MSVDSNIFYKKNLPKKICSTEWQTKRTPSSTATSYRSMSPVRTDGESIFDNYLDIIKSKTSVAEVKQSEPLDRPFDFYDDDDFAFGINLLNNNVACVGDNMAKLVQMELLFRVNLIKVMPEYPIRDSIISSINAQEPWPDNVKLFQPYEVEQILLPDNASCLAVQAFLKMCNLPFEVEMRWNAEFMSPSGRVPFIKCGAFVVSELEPIAQFAANKGVSLCGRLSTEEKAEMRAYMSLITNVLVNAELYISWIDNDTFHQVTKVRNASVYPWPLGWFQTRAKRSNVAKRLKALHWHDKTLEQVLSDVEQCCNSLSQRLGDKEYFFGAPTQLDTLIYGHVRAILGARGPKAGLLIKPITSVMLRHLSRLNSLIGFKLTPQEEYLLTQALQPTFKKFIHSRNETDRNHKAKRSRLSSVRHQSRDSINSKDLFDGGLEDTINEDADLDSHGIVNDKLTMESDTSGATEIDDVISSLTGSPMSPKCRLMSPEMTDSSNGNIKDFYLLDQESGDKAVNNYLSQTSIKSSPFSTESKSTLKMPSDEQISVENLLKHLRIRNAIYNTLPEIADLDYPTELDALVFGHVFTIITTRLPCRRLAEVVRKHEALVALAKRVDEQYFKRP